MEIAKGQTLYWVRRATQQVEPVNVQTIMPTWFTCTETNGHRTFLFDNKDFEIWVFNDPVEAQNELDLKLPQWQEEEKNKPKGVLSYMLRGFSDSE